jgi:uncharacterized protein (DUF2062 family)
MQGKISQFFKRLFMLNDTPERLSLSFALGVFLAFSPLIGLHTFLGIAFSFIFGLNRVALLLGVFINNPWTLVPIYTAGVFLGGTLVGFPNYSALPSMQWHAFFTGNFWVQLFSQWSLIKPLVLGSSILAAVASIFSYVLALYLIKNYRAHHKKS